LLIDYKSAMGDRIVNTSVNSVTKSQTQPIADNVEINSSANRNEISPLGIGFDVKAGTTGDGLEEIYAGDQTTRGIRADHSRE